MLYPVPCVCWKLSTFSSFAKNIMYLLSCSKRSDVEEGQSEELTMTFDKLVKLKVIETQSDILPNVAKNKYYKYNLITIEEGAQSYEPIFDICSSNGTLQSMAATDLEILANHHSSAFTDTAMVDKKALLNTVGCCKSPSHSLEYPILTLGKEEMNKVNDRDLNRKQLVTLSSLQSPQSTPNLLKEVNKAEACIALQKYTRGYLARRRLKNTLYAAVLIQKTWRGYRIRKDYFQNECFQMIFQKIKIANRNATQEMTLGKQTSNAYHKLIYYKNFNHLHCELQSLELSTRLSPQSCITITSKRTIKKLEEIINKSNRSEPNKLIIYSCLGILINLAKFEKTVIIFHKNDTLIDTCLRLAKIHCKCEKIMIKCLTLLYLLLTCRLPDQLKIVDHSKYKSSWSRFVNTIKVNKPNKSYRNIKFYPQWCTAVDIQFEFEDLNEAVYAICNLFNIKPKNITK